MTKAAEPAPEPAIPTYLFMYADGPLADKVGSGWRYLLVLSVGRLWVDLLNLPTLEKGRMHKQDLESLLAVGLYARAADFVPRVLLSRLKETVAQRKRLHMAYPEAAVEEAIVLLKAARDEEKELLS